MRHVALSIIYSALSLPPGELTGDGAHWAPDSGSHYETCYAKTSAVGIVTARRKGGLRVQLADCLRGKILRLDPATGNGAPSTFCKSASGPRAAPRFERARDAD